MPKGIPLPSGTLCAVDGCERYPHGAGLCDPHYQRMRRHGDPLGGRPRLSGSLIDRALAGLDQPTQGCWLWTKSLNQHGYGYFRAQGRIWRVHRVVYEHFVGPIPADLELDHLCRNRACARPDHLEAVTHRVNLARGQSPIAIAMRARARRLENAAEGG